MSLAVGTGKLLELTTCRPDEVAGMLCMAASFAKLPCRLCKTSKTITAKPRVVATVSTGTLVTASRHFDNQFGTSVPSCGTTSAFIMLTLSLPAYEQVGKTLAE